MLSAENIWPFDVYTLTFPLSGVFSGKQIGKRGNRPWTNGGGAELAITRYLRDGVAHYSCSGTTGINGHWYRPKPSVTNEDK